MLDSELVGIGGEATPRLADPAVMPEAGRECEQAQGDAGAEPGQGASAVALETELALAGPEDRLDPLADAPERAEARLLVLAVGTQEARASVGHPALELGAREALVGDDGVAGERDLLEHLAGDLPLRGVGRRQLEGDRGAVGRAEQIEAESPEVSRVRAAVAVGGIARELRAPDGLPGAPAGHRGGVEQPEPVAPRR